MTDMSTKPRSLAELKLDVARADSELLTAEAKARRADAAEAQAERLRAQADILDAEAKRIRDEATNMAAIASAVLATVRPQIEELEATPAMPPVGV